MAAHTARVVPGTSALAVCGQKVQSCFANILKAKVDAGNQNLLCTYVIGLNQNNILDIEKEKKRKQLAWNCFLIVGIMRSVI